jgi:hypothetical protein
MQNTPASELYNLLVTRDFEPEIFDGVTGKPPLNDNGEIDVNEADLFKFNWKTPTHNYGTVVILLGDENNLQVYFGDNLGKTMASEDKNDWYSFLEQMKQFAVRNRMDFQTENLSRLKYTMQGMAAIKEGLFEGYYGTRKVSYSDQPKKTRLVINHDRELGEGDARYRAIKSLFVETDAGEKFKVPSRSLSHGRLIARHCAEGGNPYDPFGQHINSLVTEMSTLARFIRVAKHKPFSGEAAELVESAIRHYQALKTKAKHMISQRGYHEEREKFDPAKQTDAEHVVETIRTMFIEQSLDQRIEEALPILARLKETNMKEADEFESWTNQVMEGTWTLPDTPEAEAKLRQLMSTELPVGADATNVKEQLYDILGDDQLFDRLADLAEQNPDADARPIIQQRMEELGVQLDSSAEPATSSDTDQDPADLPSGQELTELVGAPFGGALNMPLDEDAEQFEPIEVTGTPTEGEIHNIRTINVDLLPGFDDDSEPDDYSSSYYYRDPSSDGIFVVYTHGGQARVRGVDGMPEERVAAIAKMLNLHAMGEDLDTDGVMMTRPSNMSSESIDTRHVLNRLLELARV